MIFIYLLYIINFLSHLVIHTAKDVHLTVSFLFIIHHYLNILKSVWQHWLHFKPKDGKTGGAPPPLGERDVDVLAIPAAYVHCLRSEQVLMYLFAADSPSRQCSTAQPSVQKSAPTVDGRRRNRHLASRTEKPRVVNKSIYRPGGKTTPSREPASRLFGR